MSRTVDRYLEKRTSFDRWPLHGGHGDDCRSVIVIPALGEYPGILDTLEDLAGCEGADQTLVIVVVNNRQPSRATSDDISSNARTLAALQQWDQIRLSVAWVDASSPGHELPDKEGVGLARKIGLDLGLQIHAGQDHLSAPLICLDGDTRVDESYLTALHRFFDQPDRWAGVLPYAHPIEGDRQQQAAILCYEFFLRYHAGQLAWAGSPYGYHAIGSAMACTAEAYAAISGMNRRQAGEDFYFLQQLAKTGSLHTIPGTVVRPSGRPSHRVPFGTGRRVQRFLDRTEDEYRLYHPASYDVIRRWLAIIGKSTRADAGQLMDAASGIHQELSTFLRAAGFPKAWDRMRGQSSSAALMAQFDGWFDGFRTLKLIHHLRDTVWPDAEMFAAIGVLLQRQGSEPVVDLPTDLTCETDTSLREDLDTQRQLLEQLRHLSTWSDADARRES